MFDTALKIFLLISPILFLPLWIPGIATLQYHQFGYFNNSINLSQLQIFTYSVVMLFIISLFDKQKRFFYEKLPVLLFLIYVVGIYIHPGTIKTFPIIFLGFILYYLVSIFSNAGDIKPIFYVIFFVSLLNTIFSLLQFFNIHFIYSPKEEIIGLMGYKTHLGIYQAIAIPICFVIHPALSLIPLLGLILSKSATAFFAAVIGMAFFFRKKLFIESIIIWMAFISILSMILIKCFHQLSLRFDVWVQSFLMGLNHFITGHGIGTFHYVRKEVTLSFEYSDPYSLYLGIFHALGIFGLLTFVVFIVKKMIEFRPESLLEEGLLTSCFILVVVGLGYSFMDYARLAGTAIVLFGLITAIKGGRENGFTLQRRPQSL